MRPIHPKLDTFCKIGLLNVWIDIQNRFEQNPKEKYLCIEDTFFASLWRTDPEFKEYVINLAKIFIVKLGLPGVTISPIDSALNLLFVIEDDFKEIISERELRIKFLKWVLSTL